MTDKATRKRLRELEAKATPKPWLARPQTLENDPMVVGGKNEFGVPYIVVSLAEWGEPEPYNLNDLALIPFLRNAIIPLLDELDEAEAQCAYWKEQGRLALEEVKEFHDLLKPWQPRNASAVAVFKSLLNDLKDMRVALEADVDGAYVKALEAVAEAAREFVNSSEADGWTCLYPVNAALAAYDKVRGGK